LNNHFGVKTPVILCRRAARCRADDIVASWPMMMPPALQCLVRWLNKQSRISTFLAVD